MYVTQICQWKCNCQNPFHCESWISFRALFLHFFSILVILIRCIFLLLEGPEIGSNKLWAIQRRNNSEYFHVKCTTPFGCIGLCDCGLALIFCWIGEFWPMLTNVWTSFFGFFHAFICSPLAPWQNPTYILSYLHEWVFFADFSSSSSTSTRTKTTTTAAAFGSIEYIEIASRRLIIFSIQRNNCFI